MDFIQAPLTFGIVCYFIYMTFELFVRKQERLNLIEKMGQSLTPIDSSALKSQFSSLLPAFQRQSFTSLRIGCLLAGLGLGLLVGLLFALKIRFTYGIDNRGWEHRDFYAVAYGSSLLLFGGLGLLISYFIESRAKPKPEA